MKSKYKIPNLDDFLKREYPDEPAWKAFFMLWLDARGYHYSGQDSGIVDGSRDAGIDAIALAPNELNHMRPVVIQSKKYDSDIPQISLYRFIKTVELFRKGTNKDFEEWLKQYVRESLKASYQTLWRKRDEIEFVLVTSGRIHKEDIRHLRRLKVTIEDKGKINSLVADMAEGKTPRPNQIKIRYSSCNKNVQKSPEHKLHFMTGLLCDFAEEYYNHKDNLFAGNVRLALSGNNPVKKGIEETVNTAPEEFAYYHNGITIVCKRATFLKGKAVLVSPSIVNGAQTVTFLGRQMRGNIPTSAKVVVKIIEVIDDEKFTRFETDIAMSSNTQNKVSLSDLSVVNPDLVSLERFFTSHNWFLQRKRGKFPQGNPKGKITKDELLQCLASIDPRTGPSFTKDKQNLYKSHSARLFSKSAESSLAKKDALLLAQLNQILKRSISNYRSSGKTAKRKIGLAKYATLAVFVEALQKKKLWSQVRRMLLEDGLNKKADSNINLERIGKLALRSVLRYSKDNSNQSELTAFFKNREQVQKLIKKIVPTVSSQIKVMDFYPED